MEVQGKILKIVLVWEKSPKSKCLVHEKLEGKTRVQLRKSHEWKVLVHEEVQGKIL